MLKCEHLVKKYITTTAISDLSLEIEPGHIYALLGPNGSGKSTLMKIIAGLVKPDSGTITIDGVPMTYRSKKDIAYMPTEAFFFGYMNCKDIGKYYKDFFDDFDYDKYMGLLAEMELNPDQKAKSMSSGMLAKLKIAVTLSRDSRIVMLDEPLNGIDIIARRRSSARLSGIYRMTQPCSCQATLWMSLRESWITHSLSRMVPVCFREMQRSCA